MSGLKFSAQKLAAFSGQDLSRKGSVDEAIQDLVTFINSLDQYFTTRFVLECSPTIILIFSGQSIIKQICIIFHLAHAQEGS